jgi:hypothetical protein
VQIPQDANLIFVLQPGPQRIPITSQREKLADLDPNQTEQFLTLSPAPAKKLFECLFHVPRPAHVSRDIIVRQKPLDGQPLIIPTEDHAFVHQNPVIFVKTGHGLHKQLYQIPPVARLE